MYADIDEYWRLFGDIDEDEFEPLAIEADRILDAATTGIDNVHKLQIAMPEDRQLIVVCACKIISLLKAVADAEKAAAGAIGYDSTANGLRGKVVASMSAGNESVSFSAGAGQDTALGKAVADREEQMKQIRGIIRLYLSGVTDANGVNLLYMGPYPRNV